MNNSMYNQYTERGEIKAVSLYFLCTESTRSHAPKRIQTSSYFRGEDRARARPIQTN